MNAGPETSGSGFDLLRQFARRKPSRESCELCAVELAPEHPHLVELASRKLLCACEACALLFSGQAVIRYKRVLRRIVFLPSFRMTDSQWDSLVIPINMAFFFTNSVLQKVVAQYPSPAGAIESLLPLESWNEIAAENPAVNSMEADVEALLVNRVGHGRGGACAEYYILPIDQCYRLVGLIRAHWQGLSGGAEVWQHIADFFSGLRRQATIIGEASNA